MGSRELSEWIAYSELEPFGEERADLRAGIIASTIANSSQTTRAEAYQPRDFMPDFLGRSAEGAEDEDGREETEAARAEKLHASFEMLRLMTGGKHIHRGQDR